MKSAIRIYGLTVVAVALAATIRWLFDPILRDHLPFTPFFVAVAFAAWLQGLRPALLATGLGLVCLVFFFFPISISTFELMWPHLMGLGLYLLVCLIFAAFGELNWRGRSRLADHSERLRTTLASIGDAVITTDTHGNVTNLNGVAEMLTGWSNADAIGRPLDSVFQIVNESTRLKVENPALRALREGVVVGLANHTILIAKDGKEHAIDDSAAPIRSENGDVIGCVLIFRDISGQRQLERQAAILAAIVHSSDDAIVSKSLDGIIQSWNAGAERLFGYTAEQAIGQPMLLVIPADRASEEVDILTRIRAGERIEHFDTIRVRSDGRSIHVSLTISPVRDESGRVIGASKIARDITERKHVEEQLRQAEEQFRTLAENMSQFAWAADAKGQIYWYNQRWYDYTGATLDQMPSWGWLTAQHPDHVDRVVQRIQHSWDTGEVWEDTFPLRGKEGEYRWFLSQARPIRNEQGELVRWFGTNTDVTAEREIAEKLRVLAAELSSADHRKDEFLATLAHELRNPLAPLRSGLQLMKLASDQRDLVEESRAMMERQVDQLTRLVDDLMDVSRINRGKLELKLERLELSTVINSAIETSRPLIDQMGHRLSVSLPSRPIYLSADLVRLAQVFLNLLNNAAKYSEKGGYIELIAETKEGEVSISVKDCGIGIAADQLPRVFDLFAQVDRSLERAQGGLGIGLSLVQRIVAMHAGAVEARSEGPGRGSEFIVRLPIASETNSQEALRSDFPLRTAQGKATRVLVVDDNRDGADSLARLLIAVGHDAQVAYDGEEALVKADGFRPCVILLDIGLPKLNGYETCRSIRQQPWGKEVVIIAQTGWGQDQDRERTRDAGFDYHLVKPVDSTYLMKLLSDFSEPEKK